MNVVVILRVKSFDSKLVEDWRMRIENDFKVENEHHE